MEMEGESGESRNDSSGPGGLERQIQARAHTHTHTHAHEKSTLITQDEMD